MDGIGMEMERLVGMELSFPILYRIRFFTAHASPTALCLRFLLPSLRLIFSVYRLAKVPSSEFPYPHISPP